MATSKRYSRTSDTDIRNLMPDLATILNTADPENSARKLREAMNNPELDAAIAERDRLRAESEAREQAAEARRDEHAVSGEAPPPRVSAPSPWAEGGAEDAIDPAVLPSANAPRAEPTAAPPVTAPVPSPRATPMRSEQRRPLPRHFLPGVVVLALAPFAMWAVVSRIPPRHTPTAPAEPAASASIAPSSPPMSPDAGSAPGRASASSQESPAPPENPAPLVTCAAAPPPEVTSAPTPHRLVPNQKKPDPKRPHAGDTPHEDASASVPQPRSPQPPSPQPPDPGPGKGLRPETY